MASVLNEASGAIARLGDGVAGCMLGLLLAREGLACLGLRPDRLAAA